MLGVRPFLNKEEKEDTAVSSCSFFSLQEICLDKFLSNEHKEHRSLGRLHDAYKQFKQKKLKSLLEAILRGDRKATLDMINEYPILLLEKLENKLELYGVEVDGEIAVAPSGHKTRNKPYQVALAVEDTQLAAEIKAHLITLAGEEAAEEQGREQFPEGWEAAEEKAWEPIFEQLKTLTQVIQHAAPGDIVSSGRPDYQLTVREGSNLDNALKQFRSLLDLKANEIITTGRQFNPQLLLTAFKIYEDHLRNYFGNWDDPRALLFWQRVIGYIQRSLPANYIQAFCDGLDNTEEKLRKGLPQGRSLQLTVHNSAARGWIPIIFHPLSASRLGFDFSLYAFCGILDGELTVIRGASQRARGASSFQSLCQLKAAGMQNLCSTKSTPEPCRSMM